MTAASLPDRLRAAGELHSECRDLLAEAAAAIEVKDIALDALTGALAAAGERLRGAGK